MSVAKIGSRLLESTATGPNVALNLYLAYQWSTRLSLA
jgi:hypothetical protein